jgi:hypothetical protein
MLELTEIRCPIPKHYSPYSMKLIILLKPNVSLTLLSPFYINIGSKPISFIILELPYVNVSIGIPAFAKAMSHVIFEFTQVFSSQDLVLPFLFKLKEIRINSWIELFKLSNKL